LNNLDRFKLTLGLPLTTKLTLDDKALEELSKAGLPPFRIDRDQALHISITNHLVLLNDLDRFEDSKRKVKVAANRLKADLNIFANVTAESDRPTDYTTFKFDDVRAGAGIDLDLPIDRLRERNDYRSTLIDFESAMRTLGRQLDVKKDDIDRGLRDLERLRRSYYIQENSLQIARSRVTGEELSLQAGRRTVLNVRTAQDELVSSQNNLIDALVSHLQARLQLLLDIGVLDTDHEKFWLRADALLVPLQPLDPDVDKLPPVEEILPPDKMFQL
jgi:outer membrane protein TolC